MNHELFLISGPVEILGEGKGSLKATRTGELKWKCYFFFSWREIVLTSVLGSRRFSFLAGKRDSGVEQDRVYFSTEAERERERQRVRINIQRKEAK